MAIRTRVRTIRTAGLIGAAVAGVMIAGGGQALASAGCTAVNSGAWNLNADVAPGPNPASQTGNFAAGDQLSFTISNEFAGDIGTGTYAFTGALSSGGTGTLVNAPASTTVNFIVTTPGSGTLALTASGHIEIFDTGTCTPAAGPPADSQNLHSLQIAATQTVAAISGQAITGAVDGAISDAFGNGGNPVTFGANGVFINFAAEPKSEVAARTDDAFAALAYAGNPTKAPIFKAPSLIERDWSAWADVRGTGFDQSSAGNHEQQINVTGGIGRKLSPDLLVGVFTGYENFSYTMESISGKMTGDGGTIGSYAAWRFAEHWRIDGMLGWSDIFYNGTAGTASGSFTGSRWLGSGGLTGSYRFAAFVLEPSAHIYTLWERDNAYTDSLGTAQGVNSFSASRVSTGGKISYPWPATGNLSVEPYAGLYTDYRFSTDNALPVGVPFVGIKDGWSERVTSGVTLTSGRAGPSLSLGGELGGLGAGYEIWSANARANWPF